MIKYKNLILILFLFLISSDFISCQIKETKPFNIDFTREAVIIGSGAVTGLTAFFILNSTNPLTVQEINSLNQSDVPGFDRGAIGPFSTDYLGDVLHYGSYLLPLTFLAYGDTNKDFWELALMYGEVLLIQGSINGIVKGIVLRTRPYVYDMSTSLVEKTTTRARISFFSGHTAGTSAVTFFTAKIFTEYIKNETIEIIIWTTAALIPAITAYSRIHNHWHFPTDVMAGYTFGALVGYFIPEIHKSRMGENISITPSLNSGMSMLNLQIRF